MDIALGSEFGDQTRRIKKWERDIVIRVHGAATDQDYRTLETVTKELNQLIQGVKISLLDERAKIAKTQANLEIYFAPESHFASILPAYEPTNYGFFWTWWQEQSIRTAKILIASEGITQKERSHLIREELTQSLGLMQDSWNYPESVFYQGWTDVNEYSDLDRRLIQMLYNPRLKAGMDDKAVQDVLGCPVSPGKAGC